MVISQQGFVRWTLRHPQQRGVRQTRQQRRAWSTWCGISDTAVKHPWQITALCLPDHRFEAHQLGAEAKLRAADRPVAVFGYDYLGDIPGVRPVLMPYAIWATSVPMTYQAMLLSLCGLIKSRLLGTLPCGNGSWRNGSSDRPKMLLNWTGLKRRG